MVYIENCVIFLSFLNEQAEWLYIKTLLKKINTQRKF